MKHPQFTIGSLFWFAAIVAFGVWLFTFPPNDRIYVARDTTGNVLEWSEPAWTLPVVAARIGLCVFLLLAVPRIERRIWPTTPQKLSRLIAALVVGSLCSIALAENPAAAPRTAAPVATPKGAAPKAPTPPAIPGAQVMLGLPVHVTDKQGNPVAKAKVTPWALRSSLGHGLWIKDDKEAGFDPQAVYTDLRSATWAMEYPRLPEIVPVTAASANT